MQNANTKKKIKTIKITLYCIKEDFTEGTQRCQSKKALLVARDRST